MCLASHALVAAPERLPRVCHSVLHGIKHPANMCSVMHQRRRQQVQVSMSTGQERCRAAEHTQACTPECMLVKLLEM
jgi:hypothetical protein